MKKTTVVRLKFWQPKSFMWSAESDVITLTSLDPRTPKPPQPSPPLSSYFSSLFILHWICHSGLKYSCWLWKMNATAESRRSWKGREVSRLDRYSLMMKVTEGFESSLASGNTWQLEAAAAQRMCVCVCVCACWHVTLQSWLSMFCMFPCSVSYSSFHDALMYKLSCK